MEQSIKNRCAIVTGASSGIGKAIAVALAKEGVKVCLIGRNKENLDEAARECQSAGGPAFTGVFDLGTAEECEKAVDWCHKQLGSLHILVNNAGIGGTSDEGLDKWEEVVNADLLSVMRMTKLVLPHIEKTGDGGAIINIASVAGRKGMKNSAPYAAAKHGVVGFTESLFEDVRDKNIKVCSIEPGFVNTRLVEGKGDGSKMIQPEDIGRTVLFVLKFPANACPTEIMIMPQLRPQES